MKLHIAYLLMLRILMFTFSSSISQGALSSSGQSVTGIVLVMIKVLGPSGIASSVQLIDIRTIMLKSRVIRSSFMCMISMSTA